MEPSTSPLFGDGHRKSIVGRISPPLFFHLASGMLVVRDKGARRVKLLSGMPLPLIQF